MSRRRTSTAIVDTPIADLARSWRRYIRAEGLSPATAGNYMRTLTAFAVWLEAEDLPNTVAEIETGDIKDFLLDISDRNSPSTAAFHYRNLCAFYKWLSSPSEQAIRRSESPMLNVSEPKVTPPPRPAFTDDEVSALLKACSGKSFHALRDTAILRLFYSTGMRVSGMAGLRYAPNTPQLDNPERNDVFLDHGPQPLVRLRLKGGRTHLAPIGPRTVMALDRYLRAREGHAHAGLGELWIGPKGPVSSSGIAQMVKRRARQAGITSRVHTHRFRRTLATRLLDEEVDRTYVAEVLGWTDLRNVALYASDSEQQRAWKAVAGTNIDTRV